jgi:sulfur carrier protein
VIRVNDRLSVPWQPGMTVEAVLQACGFTYPLVVVSVNGVVIPQEQFPTTRVSSGDEVRVLHLVAGG